MRGKPKILATLTVITLVQLCCLINGLPVNAEQQWTVHPGAADIRDFVPRAHGNFPIKPSTFAPDSAALDSIIELTMENNHVPAVTACVVKGGRVIWNGAYGYADAIDSISATDSTLFIIASTSKTVVATALMQLWEDELLALDDDINAYLPFSVRNPYHPLVPITFRMLLAHTSSIAYNTNAWISLITWGGDSPIPLGQFLQDYLVPGGSAYQTSNFRTYPPGSGGEYCNIAYALLGYLVEQISGQSLEQYCQDNIFTPLGMNETSWFQSELDMSHVAVPTNYVNGQYVNYPHPGFPIYPAAQVRTSSLQLARFLLALICRGEIGGVRILESATIDSMTTVQYPDITVIPQLEWGLGLYRFYTGEHWLWGHDGGFWGIYSEMFYEKEEQFGQIVFSNRELTEGFEAISWSIYDYAKNADPSTAVLLHSFSAARAGEKALLKWEVTSSGEIDHFDVWRAETGNQFVKIHCTPLRGNLEYQFLDSTAPAGEIEYLLVVVEGDGTERRLGRVTLPALDAVPPICYLKQNHPNPFNPQTTISFSITYNANINLSVFDTSGRRIALLLDTILPAGEYSIDWDGIDNYGNRVSSGIYFCRLKTKRMTETIKMVLLR